MPLNVVDGKCLYYYPHNKPAHKGYYLLDREELGTIHAEVFIEHGRYLEYYGTMLEYGCGVDQRFVFEEQRDFSFDKEVIYFAYQHHLTDTQTCFYVMRYNRAKGTFGEKEIYKAPRIASYERDFKRVLFRYREAFYNNKSIGLDLKTIANNNKMKYKRKQL